MKSVAFMAFGGPENLSLTERPLPVPQPGEVLVRVAAAPVNPTDLLMLSGRQRDMMQGLEPPFVAGMEFAGSIAATGPGVALARGAPVFGVVNPRRPAGGAHAAFVAVPAASVAELPPGTDLLRAATLPMNGLTALLALELLGLRPGQDLLVTGGTGILGGLAIQLGRAAGLRVFAGGRAEDAALLRDLGASHVLPRGDGLVAAARAIRPDGVDGMIDGALIGTAVAQAVRDGGSAVSLRRADPVVDPRLACTCVSVVAGLERHDLLALLAGHLARKTILPRLAPDGVLPCDRAAEAFARTAAGGFRGRIVLTFPA